MSPSRRDRSEGGPGPPSWPPVYQATWTGVPAAAMPAALASASDSGNRLSAEPWIRRVGAVTRSRTEAGLRSSSIRRTSPSRGGSSPRAKKARHTSGDHLPHACPPPPSNPAPNSDPTQNCLSAPSPDPEAPVREAARSFQVMRATTASRRGSVPARSRARAPP